MEAISEIVSTFVINTIWQISALLIIAIVCARLMQSATARQQYLLWATVFVLSFSLPILSLCNYRDNSKFSFRLPFINTHTDNYRVDSTQEAADDDLTIQVREQSGSFDVSIFLQVISVCYFSFLFYRFFTLLNTWWRTARLRRSVKNEKLPALVEAIAERCRDALGMDFVPVFFSSEAVSPLTLGARKPLIILPESFLDVTCEKTLTAVLAHELAHVRRRDYGLNLVYEFLSLPVSFHPAVTIMKRKINQTREMACDEPVSESLLNPLDYARSLVQIAGFISPASHNAQTLGVFSADILEKRIMKLIASSRGANERAGNIKFLFVVILLGTTTMVTSVFSLALPTGQLEQIAVQDKTNQSNKNSQTAETNAAQQDKKRSRKKTGDEQSSTTAKEEGVSPLRILRKPTPQYTEQARRNNTNGVIRLRVTFLDSGTISDITPLNELPDGLTESAVEAAKGIKFEPAAKNGKPLTVTKTVEYSFASF